MLRIIGVILLLSGASGMAFAYCLEQRERLELLKKIKQIYEYLQNEIIYAQIPLPEICRQLGGRRLPPFDRAFAEIFKEISKNDGRSFDEIWEEQMSQCLKHLPLKKKEKKLLTGFPESFGFRERKGQATGVAGYTAEVSRCIEELEAELKNKCKAVMCIWIMGGIMGVILLL